MKKNCFLFCAVILAGCSKKETVTPAYNYPAIIITYQFKTAVKGDYSLYYYSASSTKKNVVQFNDTTWSKTDTITGGPNPPHGEVGLGTLQLVPNAAFSLRIIGTRT